MKYKVDYYTDTGTPSDNDFIGIFDNFELAYQAKLEYIKYYTGDVVEFCNNNNNCEIIEFINEVKRLNNCVVIEPIK